RPLPQAAHPRGRRLGRLVGYFEKRLDTSVSRSYERTVGLLREKGVDIVDIEVPEACERETIFPNLLPVELLATLGQHRFAAARERMDAVVAARIERGASTGAIDYVRSRRRCEELKRMAAERMEGFDAWIIPTTSRVAMPVGEFNDVNKSAELAFDIARNS